MGDVIDFPFFRRITQKHEDVRDHVASFFTAYTDQDYRVGDLLIDHLQQGGFTIISVPDEDEAA
jgi:hypothetical protein